MRAEEPGDISIYFADSTRKAVQVSMCGCSMLTDAEIPQAREWLAETAAVHGITGSSKRLTAAQVGRLLRGFVPDQAEGFRQLQAAIQPAGEAANELVSKA